MKTSSKFVIFFTLTNLVIGGICKALNDWHTLMWILLGQLLGGIIGITLSYYYQKEKENESSKH